MSVPPSVEKSIQRLALSDQAGRTVKETTAAAVLSTDAPTDAVPDTVASGSRNSVERKIAMALENLSPGPADRELGIRLRSDQVLTSIADAYKQLSQPSFLQDELLFMKSLPLPAESGTNYLATHAILPARSASPEEVLTERQDQGTGNIVQLFALAPTYRRPGRNYDSIIIPNGVETSIICVRVRAEEGKHWPEGDTGLSNWAEAWRRNTEDEAQGECPNKTDALDWGTLWMRRSENSYFKGVRVLRFDQTKDDGTRPKPFSAWFGKDKDHAQQKARDNAEHPDLQVGFSAMLYTIYTPDSKPETTTTTKGNAVAVSQTDTAGSASIDN